MTDTDENESAYTDAGKRGAPYGNTNALKHGFYSRQLRRRERNDLQKIEVRGLVDEISFMRVLVRRLMEKYDPAQPVSVDMQLVSVVSRALTCLNGLVRTQSFLSEQDDPFVRLLTEVVNEVNQDIALK